MRYTPRQWRVVCAIAFLVFMALASGLILAVQQGTLWAAAVSGGVISGILLVIAWVLRRLEPRVSWALLGAAAVPATLVWLVSPGGIGSLAVAAAVCTTSLLIGNAVEAGRASARPSSRH